MYLRHTSCSRGVHPSSFAFYAPNSTFFLLCSSLRVILPPSPRDRRSPFLVVFATRLGLAQRNGRPRPRSVSRSCHPHSLLSRPAHTHSHTPSIPTLGSLSKLQRTFLFSIPKVFSSMLTRTHVVPDGFGVVYMTGCDGA